MLIARFFTHDDASFDLPVAEGANLPMLMHAVRTDGFAVSEGFFLPYASIKYVVVFTTDHAPQQPRLNVVPFTPAPEKPAS